MRVTTQTLIALSILFLLQTANASQVHRCEDANDKITFTQQGCPIGSLQSTQRARNPTPSSSGPVTTPQHRAPAKPTASQKKLVVVGEPNDGCGNAVTGTVRRDAMVRQQIKPGMTRNDVLSSLGKPTRISHSNSNERYHYRSNDGTTRTITFDANGCVRDK